MSRRRKAIPLSEQLAAALACLLPQAQRDELRAAKVPAKAVIRLFSPDHIGLHCFEAKDRDKWHNLTPMLRGPHKEKSRRDTTIAAKVKRLREREFRPEIIGGMVALIEVSDRAACQASRETAGETLRAAATKPAPKPKPKRCIPQRAKPWPPRGSRPMRWKDAAWPK
jgi:hypothetical protein